MSFLFCILYNYSVKFSVCMLWVFGSVSMILIIYVVQVVEKAVVFLNETLRYISLKELK